MRELTRIAGYVLSLVFIPTCYSAEQPPKIVTRDCSGCHEIDGNSRLPYMPRLAGLQAASMQNKLLEFREPVNGTSVDLLDLAFRRTRHSTDLSTHQATVNMVGISHAVDAPDVKAAVLWYEKQRPVATQAAADSGLVARGRDLFFNGVAGQHIVACKACHGDQAQGTAIAPRLADQNDEYLLGQIARFRKGDRRHAPEMTAEVRALDNSQTRAVVAYLRSHRY